MNLTVEEIRFLTALVREQNQTGGRGPAHELLRKHVFPDAPLTGPGSLAFSYEAVPLTGVLFKDHSSLQEIDDFLRNEERIIDPEWPWPTAAAFLSRLEEAKKEWRARQPMPLHHGTHGKSVLAQKARSGG